MSLHLHTNTRIMRQNQTEQSTLKPCAVAGYFYPRALRQSIPAYLGNSSNVFNAKKVKGMSVREAIQHRVNIVLFACRKIDSKKVDIVLAF